GFLSATSCGVAVVALPLTVLLLERIGPAGAAWALLVAAPIATIVTLRGAGKACGVSWTGLARRIASDTWMPGAACACAAVLAVHSFPPGRWLSVIAAASTAALAYFSMYFVFGAREEERRFLGGGLDALADMLLAAVAGVYPALRAIARLSGLQASNHPCLAGIVYSIGDPYKQVQVFDSEYSIGADP